MRSLDQAQQTQLRNIEKKTGRRLILILDQVEEIYTDPNKKIQDQSELEDLIKVLKILSISFFGIQSVCPLALGFPSHQETKLSVSATL